MASTRSTTLTGVLQNLKLKHRITAETPFGSEDTDSKWAKQLLSELADGLEADARRRLPRR